MEKWSAVVTFSSKMSWFTLGFIASSMTAKHPGSELGIFGGGVLGILSSKQKEWKKLLQNVERYSILFFLSDLVVMPSTKMCCPTLLETKVKQRVYSQWKLSFSHPHFATNLYDLLPSTEHMSWYFE